MQLEKIIISNYRCFGKEPTTIKFEDLTCFIGHNSSGKTALISGLLKIFGEKISDRNITRSDFHIPASTDFETVTENNFFIEAYFSFNELEGQENSYDIPNYFRHLVVSEPQGKPFIRIRLDASWEKGINPNGVVESYINFVHTADIEFNKETQVKAAQKKLLDLIKVIYIPAIRQPNEQLKNVSGTIMYRLLNGIKWTEGMKSSLKVKTAEVEDVFLSEPPIKILTDSLKKQWGHYHKDSKYSDAKINFNTSDLESILKKVEISFAPTETSRSYTAEELGDGLRSLFYLSLVDTMLDIEESIMKELAQKKESEHFDLTLPVLTIVTVEEPENHVSPHILGRTVERLNTIADNVNSQVIMTSHSPTIVRRVDPSDIRYFRVCSTKECSEIKPILLPVDDATEYKYVKEAVMAYPELYFAKLVILGEGDSEEIIIQKMLELKNISIDSSEVSIVPLGGRHVNHFWKLLNDLNIPHITLLDLDREREGGGWGRIKYAIKQLIANGHEESKLFQTNTCIRCNCDLDSMHKWDVSKTDILVGWIEMLEEYDVYFSTPLDIDFAMLSTFKDQYISTLSDREGPRITGFGTLNNLKRDEIDKDVQKYNEEFDEKIVTGVRATLKAEGGNGSTYSPAEQEQMIWYTYFFLGRAKPITHRLLFANNKDIKYEDFPLCLKNFIDNIYIKLNS